MYYQTLMSRSLQAPWRSSLLLLLSLGGSFAQAQAPAQEQALTRTAKDTQLEWGPCPPPSQRFRCIGTSSAERMVLVAGELHVENTKKIAAAVWHLLDSAATTTGLVTRRLSTIERSSL